ncbi:hypothetical protein TNCV_2131961 [Trichonephila clavipes]|nr:hypothetical protein TNCV_2131961 [Trichonephila clavipes]
MTRSVTKISGRAEQCDVNIPSLARSGHTGAQQHVACLKVYSSCPKRNVTQAANAHILTCIGCAIRASCSQVLLQFFNA